MRACRDAKIRQSRLDEAVEGIVAQERSRRPAWVGYLTAGVQQAHKEDKISFTSLMPWPGELVCAEGRFPASDQRKVFSSAPLVRVMLAANTGEKRLFEVMVMSQNSPDAGLRRGNSMLFVNGEPKSMWLPSSEEALKTLG
jgi:hypothetical protein